MTCPNAGPHLPEENRCKPGICMPCDVTRILRAQHKMLSELLQTGVPAEAVLPIAACSALRFIFNRDPDRAKRVVMIALEPSEPMSAAMN